MIQSVAHKQALKDSLSCLLFSTPSWAQASHLLHWLQVALAVGCLVGTMKARQILPSAEYLHVNATIGIQNITDVQNVLQYVTALLC